MLLSGCSGSSQASPVDAPLARESLKVALEHWKKGEDPKSLLSSVTPMTAQDYEWAAGAKLLDYEILDQGREEDANLRVQVKITLERTGQEKVRREEGLLRRWHESFGDGIPRHHEARSAPGGKANVL